MTIHVVKPGDTIYDIANQHSISPDRLIEQNDIPNPDELVVGQTIVIPSQDTKYIVKAGQNLYDLAEKYNIPAFLLLALNPHIGNTGMLLSGQVVNLPAFTQKPEIIVNGYTYPNTSLDILQSSMPHLTYISIFSYQAKPDGSLIAIPDQPIIENAAAYHTAPKMVITNIEEGGNFSSDLVHEILSSEEIQNTLLENAIAIMQEKNYYGLDIDFEYLYPEDRERYNSFLAKARDILHASNYTLSTAIAPKLSTDQQGLLYEAHDYAAHGEYADEVIIMTYEWGYLYGPPMAVAPLDQVRKVIEYAVTQIPPEKILMGIPNYGYDWTLPYEKGTSARTIRNPEAVAIAAQVKAAIEYDTKSESPFFTYYDSDSKEHIVWFEDARSIQAKLQLVEEFNLGGVSYWTVNSSFPQNWMVLESMFNVKKEY